MKTQDRERRRVSALAREYRRKGYNVQRDAPVGDGRFRADLVVQSDTDTIVFEIKTWESLSACEAAIEQLAAYARTLPHHRFDLVLTGPRAKHASTEERVAQQAAGVA